MSDSPALVSTIIPVYNRSVWLEEAVDSVIAQSHRPLEIILVDDGSTDDTPDTIEALRKKHDPLIRTTRIANRGPGGAREAGRQLAEGAFIQYLDSDDRLLPEKFSLQVQALNDHPECGVAYGITRLVDAQGAVLADPYKWTARSFDTLFPALLVDRWWNTHTPLWRREICDAVGPWTTLRNGEDWEYEARAGGTGVRLAHVAEVLSETRQHDEARLTNNLEIDARLAAALARVQESLFSNAQRVCVTSDRPEMQHFARWAFFLARRCGELGMRESAAQCLARAVDAAETGSATARQLGQYRKLVRVFGWKGAARLSNGLRRLAGKKTGEQTLATATASHE